MSDNETSWVPVHGIWVRHVYADKPLVPDWAAASRWQTASIRAVYLADSEQTAWAEFYRALAEEGRAPADALPRELYHVRVVERVVDLRSE